MNQLRLDNASPAEIERLRAELEIANAELAKWRMGKVTEKMLRANDGAIAIGFNCEIARRGATEELIDALARIACLEKAARFALGEYRTLVSTNDLADHYLPEAMRQLADVLKENENAQAK